MVDCILLDHTGSPVYYDQNADTLVRGSEDLASAAVAPVHYDGSRLRVFKNGAPLALDAYQVRQEGSIGGIEDVSISKGGFFGAAEPASRVLVFSRTVVSVWETFRCEPRFYEDTSRYFRASSWLSVHDRKVHDPDAVQLTDNGFMVADRYYDTLENRPALDALAHDDSEIVLARGIFTDRYVRYDPLIYFVAFGSEDQREGVAVSIRSLVTIGGYKGNFCVITDRDDIASVLPGDYPGKLHVIQASAHTRLEMWRARYQIADMPHIDRYQPVLYLDTDVVCNDGITPLLSDVLMSPTVCTGTEDHPGVVIIPSLYRESKAVGHAFFERDNFFPEAVYGFNSGIIAFASIRIARSVFETVCSTINRMIRLDATEGWVDQAVLNYVLRKHSHVDDKTLSSRIAVGTGDGIYPYRDTNEVPVFVHFWSTHAHERLNRIRNYVFERTLSFEKPS